ncbi:retron system putative HNH endonuclease [Candidatus Pantoea formicae]|uniref:retron system putative HNH endonuclease n=1 Tax=Candidatus Pantoea formicae TaxID=2608355 RepID=UPI003EDB2E26
MIKINKLGEPPKLLRYRMQPGATFDGPNFTLVKSDIRKQLLKEQGFVCAYCMRRINDDVTTTKIEHWVARTVNPSRQLDYKNLLACCDGHKGSEPKYQTCDTKKGDANLTFNPSEPSHNIDNQVNFKSSGKISSNNTIFNDEISDVLNLNHHRLVQNRAIVLEELQNYLGRSNGQRTKAELQHMISEWSTRNHHGYFREYYGLVIYDLKVRVRKAP